MRDRAMSASALVDPRPPPPKFRTKRRTSPILPCVICGKGFVFRKGNANLYCSRQCAGIGNGVHSAKLLSKAAKLWASGLTVRDIARILRVSPNAVSGFTHRHRDMFPNRPSPIRRDGDE
jgi:hypothetical protein